MKLAQYKKPPREFIQGIRFDGFRVGLSTLFAPWLGAFFKAHDGVWSGSARMWVLERSKIDGKFVAELTQEKPHDAVFDVSDFVGKLKGALAAPDPDLFSPQLDTQLFPIKGGGFVCLSKFDHVLLHAVQAMGATFLRNRNAWRLRGELQAILDVLAQQAGVLRAHIYIHDTEITLEHLSSIGEDRPGVAVGGCIPERGARRTGDAEGENAILTVITTPMRSMAVDDVVLQAAGQSYGLYDYQLEGVRHLLTYNSALLADDMGLGKTRQAVVAAHLTPGDGQILVIAPANLRINWSREIKAINPEASIKIICDDESWQGAEWLLVSYERIGAAVQAISEGWIRPRVMLCDEAHYLKEPHTNRTRNAFLLSRQIDRRFLLTATPILNRESEMHTLLRLSGHPIGEIPLNEYLEQYAGKPELRKALSDRVSEWMLRRRKDVLQLKGKTPNIQYIELAPDEQKQYQQALADNSQIPLVKIGRLRRMLERFKTSWLIETISSLNEDDKSIVFCEFVEIAHYMVEEFAKAGIHAAAYVGDMSMTRKQKALDRFMTDPECRVVIGTTPALGVGHNITAANYVFFASLPWTAAVRRQAEDRAYRNGQTRHVTVGIPIVSGSIDEGVLALNKHKESIEQDLLDGGVDEKSEMTEQEVERSIASKLLAVA